VFAVFLSLADDEKKRKLGMKALRIKAARMLKGMTQQDLADMWGAPRHLSVKSKRAVLRQAMI
jgi:hypothetical protein